MSAGDGEALNGPVFGNDGMQLYVTLNAADLSKPGIFRNDFVEQHCLAGMRNHDAPDRRRRNGGPAYSQIRQAVSASIRLEVWRPVGVICGNSSERTGQQGVVICH